MLNIGDNWSDQPVARWHYGLGLQWLVRKIWHAQKIGRHFLISTKPSNRFQENSHTIAWTTETGLSQQCS